MKALSLTAAGCLFAQTADAPLTLDVASIKPSARLRNLLAHRFQLVVQRETKEQPVHALVIAKNGVEMPQLAAGLFGHVGQPLTEKAGLTAALPEQLGLRLAGKGPVEMVVIDRAERPSEN